MLFMESLSMKGWMGISNDLVVTLREEGDRLYRGEHTILRAKVCCKREQLSITQQGHLGSWKKCGNV